MEVPSKLLPYCPHCHKPMSMNLRADDTFVEDMGWHHAAEQYEEFLQSHRNQKVLFLELAVGYNTPSIVKYSFWRMTHNWPNATYRGACDLLAAKRRDPAGDCLPGQPAGPADGRCLAGGQGAGSAVCDPGRGVRLNRKRRIAGSEAPAIFDFTFVLISHIILA